MRSEPLRCEWTAASAWRDRRFGEQGDGDLPRQAGGIHEARGGLDDRRAHQDLQLAREPFGLGHAELVGQLAEERLTRTRPSAAASPTGVRRSRLSANTLMNRQPS